MSRQYKKKPSPVNAADAGMVKPAIEDMTSQTLVARLLEHSDDLTERELDAFAGMQAGFECGHLGLSKPQRDWAEDTYTKKVEHHYAENLVSSGKAKKTKSKIVYDWEKPENRPLKPPGR